MNNSNTPYIDFELPLISVKNRNYFHKKHYSTSMKISMNSPKDSSTQDQTFGKKKNSLIKLYLES